MTTTTTSKRIGTHSGTFHCDEALACALLHKTQEFAGAEIVRSRDEKVWVTCDVLVDVGGVYDPTTHRYDHHQRDFTTTFDGEHDIKLSSAGLVYKHFGREVIRTMTGVADDALLDVVYMKVYNDFIMPLDAIDNGVSQYPKNAKPKYTIRTDLSSRVAHLNPNWNEDDTDVQERFYRAMALTGGEFTEFVMNLYNSWLPARKYVVDGINQRKQVHPSGAIIRFDKFVPWKSHLHQLEEEMKLGDTIKYALYTDQSGQWRVQAVPVSEGSFVSRKALPEPWRGARDDQLDALVGGETPGCVFVHASGFIGGHKTYEGALHMASLALAFGGDNDDNNNNNHDESPVAGVKRKL